MNDKKNEVIYKHQPLWGSWVVDSLIGEGSYGKVYKVKKNESWGNNEHISAVKVVSVPSSPSEIKSLKGMGHDENSLRQYFEGNVKSIINEIELMYKLRGNTNIVSYEDYKVINKEEDIGWDIFIKMEYLTSLDDYIEKNQIRRKDVIKLGIDICSALELCSNLNIIHRDIKEENIFISTNGSYKLGDFGIAKVFEQTSGVASIKGTPYYMAPEVYKGSSYDHRVDIYSLGIVLYKLLNYGRIPFAPSYPKTFKYEDLQKAFEMRISGNLFPEPDAAGDKLRSVVLKACKFEPENRFDNASQFKKALEETLSLMTEEEKDEVIYENGASPNKKDSISTDNLSIAIDRNENLDNESIDGEKTISVFEQKRLEEENNSEADKKNKESKESKKNNKDSDKDSDENLGKTISKFSNDGEIIEEPTMDTIKHQEKDKFKNKVVILTASILVISSLVATGVWFSNKDDKLDVATSTSATIAPTRSPNQQELTQIKEPTMSSTKAPTKAPTKVVTSTSRIVAPTVAPTKSPTKAPTKEPTATPTKTPTISTEGQQGHTIPKWSTGINYNVGDEVLYGEILYKCLRSHSSTENTSPAKTNGTLWEM